MQRLGEAEADGVLAGRRNARVRFNQKCLTSPSDLMLMVFFLFLSIRSFSHTSIQAHRPPSTKSSESICLSNLIRQCCDKTTSHSETYSSSCSVIPFVWGLCSAAWLRGSERAKLANSLEDLYVWVRLVISAFQWTYFCILGTVCRCIFSALHVCPVFTGRTWGRASSICGWKKSENSLLRDPRVQKLVGCVKTNLSGTFCNRLYI